ncbi:hypothetical protein [Nocardiopsis nanhaiensis]
MSRELDALRDATTRYRETEAAHKQSTEDVRQKIVDALEAGETPTDVNREAPHTPAYVRRIAKEAGVSPRPRGPKKQD